MLGNDEFVIARSLATKQSRISSVLDCFASLAMTKNLASQAYSAPPSGAGMRVSWKPRACMT